MNRVGRLITPWLFLGFCLVFMLLTLTKIQNWDWGFHLSIGKHIHEYLSLPEREEYSFWAEGRENKIISWSFSLLLYEAYALWGFAGMVLLKAIAFGALALFILLRLKQELSNKDTALFLWMSALCMLLLFLCIKDRILARPEIFGFVYLCMFSYFIQSLISKTGALQIKTLWILILIQILWVNIHISFVLGPIYFTSFIVGYNLQNYTNSQFSKNIPQQLGALLAIIISTLANPYGVRIYELLYDVMESAVYLFEMRTNLTIWALWSLKGAMGLGAVWAAIYWSMQKQFTKSLPLIAFIILGANANRFFAVASIIGLPLMAGALYDVIIRYRDQSAVGLNTKKLIHWGTLSFFVVIFGVLVERVYSWTKEQDFGLALKKERFPYGAVDYVRKHQLSGNMFNNFGFGAFLMWELYPSYQVFIDGRTQVYGKDLNTIYNYLLTDLESWNEIVKKYNIQFAIVRHPRLVAGKITDDFNRLFQTAWKIVYADNNASIYVLREDSNGHLAEDTAAYEKVIKVMQSYPQFFLAYNNRGSQLLELKRYQEAIQDFTKAIQLNPQYAQAYYNRGLGHAHLGNDEQAIADYTRSIHYDAQFAPAYNNRGVVYQRNAKSWNIICEDWRKACQLGDCRNFSLAQKNGRCE